MSSSTGGVGETATPPKVDDEPPAPDSNIESDVQANEVDEFDTQLNDINRIIPSIKGTGATARASNNLNLYTRPGQIENHSLL